MHIVPRTCIPISEESGPVHGLERASISLDQLRDIYAYVLLGDPGAGKSKAFETEAVALGVRIQKARNFLTLELDPADWKEKTIFIDGLDETRASGSDGRTILDAIRAKLDKLGRPRFRLSCRAADWLGESDGNRLKALVPEGRQFEIFRLNPLTGEDVKKILKENFDTRDPDAFVEEAEKSNLSELLYNPQTLGMLARAVGPDNVWPASRWETYQLACLKLIQESNAEHLAATRGSRPADNTMIDAAGRIFTMLLIADKQAISLSPTTRTDYLQLDAIDNPEKLPLSECLHSRLFTHDSDDAFAPIHRTVAEYMAASYLARKIDLGLSIARIQSLICGADGGIVTGMRGLHAWLATCSVPARKQLIDTDPLGVLLYGDVQNFAAPDKVWILRALARAAKLSTGFRWQNWSAEPFGPLATPDMVDEFDRILRSSERDDASQAVAECVVEGMLYGERISGLDTTLLDIVRDKSRWPVTRKYALRAYLTKYLSEPKSALKLLAEIEAGQLDDADDELLGTLLKHLYPAHVSAADIVKYLHPPKNASLLGNYEYFWRFDLEKRTSREILGELLDAFTAFRKPTGRDRFRDYWKPVSTLLPKGLEALGDQVQDDTLLKWLSIGLDEHGHSHLEQPDEARIQGWFSRRPERYLGLMETGLKTLDIKGRVDIWALVRMFHGAPQPADMEGWWLSQSMMEQNDERAKAYLSEAIAIAASKAENKSPFSANFLEEVVKLAEQRPGFIELLRCPLTADLSRQRWKREEKRRKEKFEETRKARAQQFRIVLPALRGNTANPGTLHTLAAAYFQHFHDVTGETSLDRLHDLLNYDNELIDAAKLALVGVLIRGDLPSVEQIIESHQSGKIYYLSLPLLAGMELWCEHDLSKANTLPEEVLLKALMSRYTYGANEEPHWFMHLVATRPDLVAQTIIIYVHSSLKARVEHIHGVYALAHIESYVKVAKLAVPVLLERFPHRASLKQLSVLEDLIKAVIRYLPVSDVKKLVESKLSRKSIDVGQKIYWMTAGLILAPERHEKALRSYIGQSEIRVGHFSHFLHDRSDQWRHGHELPESSLSLMIELLGPHCRPERPTGAHFVNAAMNRADLVRSAINRLAASGDKNVSASLVELENLPALVHWSGELRHARLMHQVTLRDTGYRHPEPQQIAETLRAGKPANAADVAAIVREVLDGIVRDIRGSDLDVVNLFWNLDSHDRPSKSKPEPSCSKSLALILRERLKKFSIECVVENQHARKKRSDIWCTYQNWGVPIEIKKDSHDDLWKAMNSQLIAQYSIDPRAQGYGIYLVLWFGGGKDMASPVTGKKPADIESLEVLLRAQIDEDKRKLISAFVLDCSVSAPHPTH